MTTITQLLRGEIRKEAAKVVREKIKSLDKDLKTEHVRVRDLERQVKALTRQLHQVGSGKAAAAGALPSAFRSSAVTDLRNRHNLSQNALATLLGVGLNTVWLWEKGRTQPRARQQEGIDALATLNPAQLKRRLTRVGLKTGRSKPGRKPGSTKAKPVQKRASTKKKATAKRKTAPKKVQRRKATRGK